MKKSAVRISEKMQFQDADGKQAPSLEGSWWRGAQICGGFLKWWYPTTMGFPTKNDHFGVFWGIPPFTETSMWTYNDISLRIQICPKISGFPLYSYSGDGMFWPSILLDREGYGSLGYMWYTPIFIRIIQLMEEIPNNHLGYIKPCK